jgi:hypothetical protein
MGDFKPATLIEKDTIFASGPLNLMGGDHRRVLATFQKSLGRIGQE